MLLFRFLDFAGLKLAVNVLSMWILLFERSGSVGVTRSFIY